MSVLIGTCWFPYTYLTAKDVLSCSKIKFSDEVIERKEQGLSVPEIAKRLKSARCVSFNQLNPHAYKNQIHTN